MYFTTIKNLVKKKKTFRNRGYKDNMKKRPFFPNLSISEEKLT